MVRVNQIVAAATLVATVAAPALARTWTDASGAYSVEADLVGYTEDSVIIKRCDQHLAAIEIEKLSDDDKRFVATEEARLAAEKLHETQQTWTSVNGVTIIGNVVDYVSKEVTFERKRGKVFVNGRVFKNLPKVYQQIAPKIVSYYESNNVSDEASLGSWLAHRRAEPATYQVDGVVMELPGGDEYAFPFFLFQESDLEVLKPGWDRWAAMNDDYQSRRNAGDELRTMAAAYQSNQQANQQIARLQLGMQAVNAGVTSLWEVTLYPGRGVAGQPIWAVVPGRDSRVATANALANNPGYVAGPVRRVSN